jgi:glycine oxidase
MKAGIAGAGIMGQLLALFLIREGWDVTLFEQNMHTSDNCSHAAAGLLAPFSELDKSEAIISELGQEGLRQLWPSLLKNLDRPEYFKLAGTIVVHHPQDSSEWQYFSKQIDSKVSNSYQILDQKTLNQLEPGLKKFEKAYFFQAEGQIDSQALLSSLNEYLQNYLITACKITDIKSGIICTKKQSFNFDIVFDCRGLNARSSFPNIRAIRGELIWVQAPEVSLQRPVRLLHPRYNLYVVPRPNHIYIIGSSEIEAEDYSPISVRSTLELLTAAYYLHPGFAEARIIKSSTQCRPCLPDHLPCLKSYPGLIAVNGLYRHGYLIAPALAQEIIRHLYNTELQYPTLWEKT